MKRYAAIFLLIMLIFMVGCSSQQSANTSHEPAKKQANTQPAEPQVKLGTKVNTYVYDYPSPVPTVHVYICGTITNQSKVPIVISSVM